MAAGGGTFGLDELNRAGPAEFVRALGGAFETSPWVAERAWSARPFASVRELHRAMTEVVRKASAEERLGLLRAHPDLAGKAARAGRMGDFSKREQGGAGLDRLSDEEYGRFGALNQAYRERFGFPFIICVRNHAKASILEAFERRLGNPMETEIQAALEEVFEIARYRLEALVEPGARA